MVCATRSGKTPKRLVDLVAWIQILEVEAAVAKGATPLRKNGHSLQEIGHILKELVHLSRLGRSRFSYYTEKISFLKGKVAIS